MQGEQQPRAMLIKHFHSTAEEHWPLAEGWRQTAAWCVRSPLGQALPACPQKRNSEDSQRSICLAFLNNSESVLEAERALRSLQGPACRSGGSGSVWMRDGRLSLPEGDSRPLLQPLGMQGRCYQIWLLKRSWQAPL